MGVRHRILETKEITERDYQMNPPDRCYFCKSELYNRLIELAAQEGVSTIANGTNCDDLGDYRPGLQAASEYKVVSPLKDAGLGKEDIRALAKQLGIKVWDKPASPCLASRIPYGSPVTVQKLRMVEQAERYLKGFGIRELRVRHFGRTARIEVAKAELGTIQSILKQIRRGFRQIGFQEVDVSEFRSGALNDVLQK
jgi:uncharacterized protein